MTAEIKKTVTYLAKEKTRGLVGVVNNYALLSLLALPMILGLEIAFQVRCGNLGAPYFCGFLSIFYGANWIIVLLLRRSGLKGFSDMIRSRGDAVEQSVT